MTTLDLLQANLLSPPVLCFALGALAVAARSDLRVPEPVFAALSMYLMLSIGLRGGAELGHVSVQAVAAPIAGAFLICCAIPLWCYAALRRLGRLSVPDSAALAAHYGSVSAVTFAAVTAMLDRQAVSYEGYAATLLAVMEVPAIIVAIGLARVAETASAGGIVATGSGGAFLGANRPVTRGGGQALLAEVLSSKSVLILIGGLAIGALAGSASLTKVKPFFVDLFPGALCVFLLALGHMAASRASEFRKAGVFLVGFALLMPLLHATLGLGIAYAVGLSMGGAIILATLAASASYIAAPAAVQLALPEANPSLYLTCSLAITFPFNIALGLPLYQAMAQAFYG
ncbi:sodium-dependent bicarbonate transport family permease [Methylobacterium durans]|uniref:Sodium-dependent bicarbonate transport family permease n=1 Tax=Methylobacterium durans TaxID=2202825 RepID=A0A2U8W554_9HYPH|nr:sodium-dependent bicarbonate transport family permease [Methylobacterium durans]AWN40758.1 sodium-dependent bicarbonate transport family permease [Methylobacterium durans]